MQNDIIIRTNSLLLHKFSKHDNIIDVAKNSKKYIIGR